MSSKREEKDNSDDVSETKIDKWDGSAVKNVLDDAVKNALTNKPYYTECFALLNGRLIICTTAVGVAMWALIWDYFHPFPESRSVLIACVCSYFVLMGILALYTTFKEKGIFAVVVQTDPTGSEPDFIWEASSCLKNYDDKYNLVLSVKDTKTGKRKQSSVTKSVANFIDVNGVVVIELVEKAVYKMQDSLTNQRKNK